MEHKFHQYKLNTTLAIEQMLLRVKGTIQEDLDRIIISDEYHAEQFIEDVMAYYDIGLIPGNVPDALYDYLLYVVNETNKQLRWAAGYDAKHQKLRIVHDMTCQHIWTMMQQGRMEPDRYLVMKIVEALGVTEKEVLAEIEGVANGVATN